MHATFDLFQLFQELLWRFAVINADTLVFVWCRESFETRFIVVSIWCLFLAWQLIILIIWVLLIVDSLLEGDCSGVVW